MDCGRPGRWTLAFGVTLTLGAVFPAFGQVGEDVPTVAIVGDPRRVADSRALETAMRAQLAGLEAGARLVWPSPTPEATAEVLLSRIAEQTGSPIVVWCDVSRVDSVLLFLARPGGGRIVARTMEDAGSTVAGRQEALAIVVRTLVQAVPRGTQAIDQVAGRLELVDFGEEPPAADADASAPVRRPAGGILFGGGYCLRGLSADHAWTQGIGLFVAPLLGRHLGIVAGYAVRPGVRVADPDVVVRLTLHDIQIGIALDGPAGPVRLGGLVAAELGLQRWDAEVWTSGFEALPGGVESTFGLLAVLRLEVPIREPVGLLVSGGIRPVIVGRSYVVEGTDGVRAVLRPWGVQPSLELQLVARFDGD